MRPLLSRKIKSMLGKGEEDKCVLGRTRPTWLGGRPRVPVCLRSALPGLHCVPEKRQGTRWPRAASAWPSGPSHSWPDRPALPGWASRSITGLRSVRGRRCGNRAPIHAAAARCPNPRLPGVMAVPVGRTQPWERRGQSWGAAWRGPWGRGGGHPATGGGGNGAPLRACGPQGAPSVRPLHLRAGTRGRCPAASPRVGTQRAGP